MLLAPLAALVLLAEGPVTLEWRAPEECPDREVVLAGLAGLVEVADDAADPTPRTRVRATAVTRRIGEVYQLDLRIQTTSVALRRRLVTEDCATLAEATALLVAIVLDPLEVTAQVSSEAAEPRSRLPADDLPLAVGVPAEPPAAASPPAALPRRPAPVVVPVRRTTPLVRLDAAIDAGATPGVTGDVGGAIGLLRPRLRLELHGLYTVPRALHVGTQQVGRLARWALGFRGCARIVQRRLEVPLCLGLEGGQFLATGAGITVRPLDARPPWLAGLAGLGLIWSPVPRLGLGARADLVVAPFRAPFTVGGQVVHTPEVVGVRVGLGAELRFGFDRRDGTASVRPQPR
ncbi:MAG: hypothetical protein H0T76_17730 [Nannocystis sp.]|nr:hypothetical protein [Nannocystis sp.]MBA3548325.1 hypothetical protein [Nannocystis sp.]